MKVEITRTYRDTQLKKRVNKYEVLNLTKERGEVLLNAGIAVVTQEKEVTIDAVKEAKRVQNKLEKEQNQAQEEIHEDSEHKETEQPVIETQEHVEDDEQSEALDYQNMTKDQLMEILVDRKVDFHVRDSKDDLVKLAQDSDQTNE